MKACINFLVIVVSFLFFCFLSAQAQTNGANQILVHDSAVSPKTGFPSHIFLGNGASMQTNEIFQNLTNELNDELFAMPLADVIVEDFLVNDHLTADNAGHDYSAVAYADNGKYIICWADDRNGNWDIYAQIYNADG
ncbi:MAG: hypothetical protein GXO74_04715 [Calditrichaeota bacterium]|nr:hypothetical protein [Calditrichota bacterium]